MKLATVLRSARDPLSAMELSITMDRRITDVAWDNWDALSQVSRSYDPKLVALFKAPYSWVPMNELQVYRSHPSRQLTSLVFQQNYGRYVFHPGAGLLLPHTSGEIDVTPTASTRTLVLRGLGYDAHVKTHLPLLHCGFHRYLTGLSVSHSIAISREMANALKNPSMPYGYMPEDIGLVYGDPIEGIGNIYRDPFPRPRLRTKRIRLSGFVFYATDPDAPNDEPLALQLIDVFAGDKPLDYLVENICGPVQDVWLYCLREFGLILELHGQNIQFELDLSGWIQRIIVRDFMSVTSDWHIRNTKGLRQLDRHVIKEEEVLRAELSLEYDYIMGEVFFRRLIQPFCQKYGISEAEVVRRIAERFRRVAGHLARRLPDTTFGFAGYRQVGQVAELADTGRKPDFR